MPTTKSMKVLKKAPGKAPEVITIDGSLSSMQDVVGGYIQTMPVPRCKAIMVCNEEGKIFDLPHNITLMGRHIVGTVFFCCSTQGAMTALTASAEKEIRQLLMVC